MPTKIMTNWVVKLEQIILERVPTYLSFKPHTNKEKDEMSSTLPKVILTKQLVGNYVPCSRSAHPCGRALGHPQHGP